MTGRPAERLNPEAGVLTARLATRVPPWLLVRLLDDGAAMVWSDPGGAGAGGFLGLTGDRADVVLLDADDRVTIGGHPVTRPDGAGVLTGLDGLTDLLRARLVGAGTWSSVLGWWGWLGYEAGARALPVPHAAPDGPTAAFALVDRGVRIDGSTGELTLVVDAQAPDAERWLVRTAARIAGAMPDPVDETPGAVRARRRLGRADYLDRIHACLEAITRGDAYQLCLTTTVEVELPPAYDPLAVYLRLRRTSPAPYGGLVRIGDRWLLSSSPERFLAVDVAGRAVTSPIKGTRPRSADAVLDRALAAELAADQKERAENVMIVDLCRNDLSQVSQIGSVQVSELFAVQSHPQVHQLVSTVESRLVTDALGATRALFPAGSMTGAPKRSAMSLLAGLEMGPRGAYSGVWGRFGTDGSAELAVVIRSIEIRPGRATLGTGGGITIGSDPVREWDETVLKAKAGLAALGVG